ncbi:MAG: NeuD/PglB/VioB family sugar acetyltransferase, partial [Rhodothermales bacterium]|nr:NeuD/PglB/VioB family sugar acetyltransferase [Rhodothermales bacterium]
AGGAFDILGFVDDDPALQRRTVLDLPVLGAIDWLVHHPETVYVVAIGASRLRRRIVDLHRLPVDRAATLVHPSVELHPSVHLSPGCLIFRGAVVMLNVALGDHVIVDVNSTVGHDTTLGAFSTMHPGCHVSGNVVVEEAVELGAGAVVLPGRRIGREVIVGAGAVVHRDLPAGCTAVGVPARPLPGTREG